MSLVAGCLTSNMSGSLCHGMAGMLSVASDSQHIYYLDGKEGVCPKSPAYMIGEKILRPLIHRGTFCLRKIASAVVGGIGAIDGAVSRLFNLLPLVSAEKIAPPPVLNCSEPISSPDMGAFGPSWMVDMSTQGDIIAVGGAQVIGDATVSATELFSGTEAWTPPVQLSPTKGASASIASGVGRDGTALSVWYNKGAMSYQQSLFSPGASWSPPMNITNWGVTNVMFSPPTIALSEQGGAAVWNTVDYRVQSSDYVNKTWSVPVNIGISHIDSVQMQRPPAVALTSFGNGIVAWPFNTTAIHASSRLAGKPWSSPTLLFTCNDPQNLLIGAMTFTSENGDALAIGWTPASIQAAVLPLNSTWSPAVTLFNGSLQDFNAAMDAQGNAVAVWTVYRYNELFVSYLPRGGVWGPPLLIKQGSDSLSVALDSKGNAYVAWVQSPNYLFYTTCSFSNETCVTPEYPALIGGFDLGPVVKVTGKGQPIIFWAGGGSYYAIRCSIS